MAKTMGKDRGSGFRRGSSSAAEPEADLLEASDDELQDQELVVAEDDGSVEEADTDDALSPSERALMAPTNAPGELRRVEGRPRSVHIPEPIMANPVTRYVAESYVELRYNTTWPTWRTAWNFTLIVIAMSVVVAIILGAADFALVHALTWFVSLGH